MAKSVDLLGQALGTNIFFFFFTNFAIVICRQLSQTCFFYSGIGTSCIFWASSPAGNFFSKTSWPPPAYLMVAPLVYLMYMVCSDSDQGKFTRKGAHWLLWSGFLAPNLYGLTQCVIGCWRNVENFKYVQGLCELVYYGWRPNYVCLKFFASKCQTEGGCLWST